MSADHFRLGIASALGLAAVGLGLLLGPLAYVFLFGACAGVTLAVLVPEIEAFARGVWARIVAGAISRAEVTAARPNNRNPPIHTNNPLYNPLYVAKPAFVSRKALHSWFSVAKNLAGFLWRWKWAILVLALFLSLGSMLKSCVPFGDIGKSKGEIARERDRAEATLERQVELDRAVVRITGEWHTLSGQIRDRLATAREQIEDVPRETADLDFLLAWAGADRGLLDGERPA